MQEALKYISEIKKAWAQPHKKQRCKLPKSQAQIILDNAKHDLSRQTSDNIVIHIKHPVTIIGDLNGHIQDLLRILEIQNWVSNNKHYLFLGNYGNGGRHGLETILFVLCLKFIHPHNIHLLRGKGQTETMFKKDGLYHDCMQFWGTNQTSIESSLLQIFINMPIAAIIKGKIFCVNGGLTPQYEDCSNIFRINKQIEPIESDLSDFLWSEYSETTERFIFNKERKMGHIFGPHQVNSFLKRNKFDLLINSGVFVQNGYRVTCEEKLVTIFSASDFLNHFGNSGCYLNISEDLRVNFIVLEPKKKASMSQNSPIRKRTQSQKKKIKEKVTL